MTFTVNPDVGVTLGATTHLTSQVGLGLNALDIVSANIYLFFDTALGLQGNVSSTANPQPCLSGNAEISVGVGAKGTLFGLLPDSNNETIYDEHFPLFQVRAHSQTIYLFFWYSSLLLHDDRNAFLGTCYNRLRIRSSTHTSGCFTMVAVNGPLSYHCIIICLAWAWARTLV